MPEVDAVEPQRTELALARAFNCGLGFRRRIARSFFRRELGHYVTHDDDRAVGRKLERLYVWLIDGTARSGAAFLVVRVLIQMGIAITMGFFYAHPYRATYQGQVLQLAIVICLHVFAVFYYALGTANDIWNGVLTSAVHVLEASAMACMLASVCIVNADSSSGIDTTTDAKILQTVQVLELATTSVILLRIACFGPLMLILYDGIVVPIVRKVWHSESGSLVEVFCELLIAGLLIPLQIFKYALGVTADAANVVDDFADSMAEVASNILEGEDDKG